MFSLGTESTKHPQSLSSSKPWLGATVQYISGFPDSSVGRIHLQCRRPGFNSWVRKIPWGRDRLPTPIFLGFPCGSAGKESACNPGDLSSVPGLGRSPGERKGYPLQYSGLENSMDYTVTKSVRHNGATFTFTVYIKPYVYLFSQKLFPCKIGELATFFLILALYNPAGMYYIWFNTSLLLMDSCLVSSLRNWEQLF